MYKIAVMGDRESVMGFRALGLDVFYCGDRSDAAPTLKRLASEGYPIIYITEQLVSELTTEIAAYKDVVSPAIIPIPGKSGSMGLGMSGLRSAVERAIGANILD